MIGAKLFLSINSFQQIPIDFVRLFSPPFLYIFAFFALIIVVIFSFPSFPIFGFSSNANCVALNLHCLFVDSVSLIASFESRWR